jgi:dTMP kinase
MQRGAFITIEGGEGMGKSTSLAAIEQAIVELGHDIVVTREPGGSALGELIRSWILDGSHQDLSAQIEALLMFAARAQHLAEKILPALAAGQWVLCDRFTDATRAYQGGGRGLSRHFIDQLADEVQGDLRPDLTFLLDAPVEVGIERIKDRPLDHFERSGTEFLQRVRQCYLDLAAAEPERIKVIDASMSPDAVATELLAQLHAFASLVSDSDLDAK